METQPKATWSHATFLALCEAVLGIAKISELSDVYRLVPKYRELTEDDKKIVDGQPGYRNKVRAEIMRFKYQGIVRSPARGRYTVDKARLLDFAEKRLEEEGRKLGVSAERLAEIRRMDTAEERVKALFGEHEKKLREWEVLVGRGFEPRRKGA